jgi:hypothetical protein
MELVKSTKRTLHIENSGCLFIFIFRKTESRLEAEKDPAAFFRRWAAAHRKGKYLNILKRVKRIPSFGHLREFPELHGGYIYQENLRVEEHERRDRASRRKDRRKFGFAGKPLWGEAAERETEEVPEEEKEKWQELFELQEYSLHVDPPLKAYRCRPLR